MILPTETSPIPTLLTIEQSWLGPQTVHGPPLCINEGHLQYHTVSSQNLMKKLLTIMLEPFALCNSNSQLICFVGKTKTGTEHRIYDIISLHKRVTPTDSNVDSYDSYYISLIQQRATSQKERVFTTCYSRDPRELATRAKQVEREMRLWYIKETIAYVNRYAAWITCNKDGIVVAKKVELVRNQLETTIELLNEHAFIRNFGTTTTADEKDCICSIWLRHQNRLSYSSLVFTTNPPRNSVNLWQGLPFSSTYHSANEYDAEPFYQHVYEVLCNKNENVFLYTMKLFAHYVQKPMTKTEVCLVLKSRQGAGKGYVVEGILRHIFGSYYQNLRIAQATGRFNMCLLKCLLLFLDETVPAWNKKIAAELKTLITSPTQTVEEKGLPLQHVDNHVNVIMATNYYRACPMEESDRRYFVLELSNHRCAKSEENTMYWKKVWAVSPVAVYKALMSVDISDFVPRDFPVTNAQRDEKEEGLCTIASWWLYELRNGDQHLFCGRPLAKQDMYNRYVDWIKENEPNKKPTSTAHFWKMMLQLVGELEHVQSGSGSSRNTTRERCVFLPTLDICIRMFCDYVNDPGFFATS